MAKPKLALIPATQGSKLYSVLPADGVGDFNFSRNSAATRINKDGLIETVAVGKSRLNYPLIDGVVNGCPSHLLEPQRINLLPYSEDFSQSAWTKGGSSVVSGFTSPKGDLSAFKLVEDTSTGNHRFYSIISITSGLTYSQSIFAKAGNRNILQIAFGGKLDTTDYVNFNLTNGTVSSQVGNLNPQIEYFNDGWYRCSVFTTSITTGTEAIYYQVQESPTASRFLTYTGDVTKGIYVWGAQLEQGSYPTSYIPTTSSAVTRVAETANGAGDASTFNDSEGVLMVEMSALANDSYRFISLSDGSNDNNVRFNLSPTANQIGFSVTSGGSGQVSYFNNNTNVLLNTKVSIKYKQNDFSVWINGFKLYTNPSGSTPIALDRINFDRGTGGNVFNGSAKQIQYFDSALNDSDLEKITSWTSFTDLANGQTYSIK